MKTITFKCCEAFEAAKQPGTDSEGWCELMIVGYPDEIGEGTPEGIIMGCKLPLINFCPWCGTKVEHTWAEGAEPVYAVKAVEPD